MFWLWESLCCVGRGGVLCGVGRCGAWGLAMWRVGVDDMSRGERVCFWGWKVIGFGV